MLAHISLGSNLSNPKQQIHNALITLGKIQDIEIVSLSSLYRSQPIDGSKQPDYLNAVCSVNTQLAALELLRVCQHVENLQHRVREKKWGARTIDLDIILYNAQIISSKDLIVPHPEIMNRAFVLVPLLEIEGNIKIPNLGNLQDLIDKINIKKLTKL